VASFPSGHANCLDSRCANAPTNTSCATATALNVAVGTDTIVVGDIYGATESIRCGTGFGISTGNGQFFSCTAMSAGTLSASTTGTGPIPFFDQGSCNDSENISSCPASVTVTAGQVVSLYLVPGNYSTPSSSYVLTLHLQ
jgi:hypothetical protein